MRIYTILSQKIYVSPNVRAAGLRDGARSPGVRMRSGDQDAIFDPQPSEVVTVGVEQQSRCVEKMGFDACVGTVRAEPFIRLR